MKMKQLACAGALILGASAAMAGYVQPAPVSVTLNADGSGAASGDMLTARHSKNTVELIGCGVRRISDGSGGIVLSGFCQATDANNVFGGCFTDNPGLIESLSSLADYSFITFSWNADGTCTAIGNSTQSIYLPSK